MFKKEKDINLEQYLGLWYEVASTLPSYQKSCRNTTAEYIDNNDNYIDVVNSCDKKGKNKRSKTRLKGFKKKFKNKLKVTIFPFVISKKPNYTIEFVDDSYQNAIVTAPDTVWFLARDEEITQNRLDQLIDIAKEKKIDISKMVITSDKNDELILEE